MKLGVKLQGTSFARAQLATVNRKVDPVLRGALNTTATKTRTQDYVKPIGPILKSSLLGRQLSGADTRGKIRIKRARRGMMNARVIPSSSGIRVDDYKRWVFEALSATRGRVYVYGLRGQKLAAGFVNPSSNRQTPLSTRIKRGKISAALGPSIAYWFKQLSTPQMQRRTNAFLQREFERRLRAEIAKGIR
ncbi:hypothetical protein [Halopseudomonas aestusnigri]|uniref:hypothetical protein n=1 Tax=Halopseudomonas aestusnigri TaxID=857252 RepID=UPI0028BFC9E7|nr:hypothetical protein YSKK_13680 [Halopseudomonas aestusnigri]